VECGLYRSISARSERATSSFVAVRTASWHARSPNRNSTPSALCRRRRRRRAETKSVSDTQSVCCRSEPLGPGGRRARRNPSIRHVVSRRTCLLPRDDDNPIVVAIVAAAAAAVCDPHLAVTSSDPFRALAVKSVTRTCLWGLYTYVRSVNSRPLLPR